MSDPKSRTGDQDRKELMKLCAYVFADHIWTTKVDLSFRRIYANGGNCAQIAALQLNLFVVYGGTTTRECRLACQKKKSDLCWNKMWLSAYDLKLLIDKGFYDVIKPAWLEDSIASGALAPFKKRCAIQDVAWKCLYKLLFSYFFHATDSKKNGVDYYLGGGDTNREVNTSGKTLEPPQRSGSHHEITPKIEDDLHDWLKVEEEERKPQIVDDGSATDPDSEDEGGTEYVGEDLADWLQVHHEEKMGEPSQTLPTQTLSSFSTQALPTQTLSTSSAAYQVVPAFEQPVRQESVVWSLSSSRPVELNWSANSGAGARYRDGRRWPGHALRPRIDLQTLVGIWVFLIDTLYDMAFRCFYLDTPENAEKNGMTTKSKYKADISKRQDPLMLRTCIKFLTSFKSGSTFQAHHAQWWSNWRVGWTEAHSCSRGQTRY